MRRVSGLGCAVDGGAGEPQSVPPVPSVCPPHCAMAMKLSEDSAILKTGREQNGKIKMKTAAKKRVCFTDASSYTLLVDKIHKLPTGGSIISILPELVCAQIRSE